MLLCEVVLTRFNGSDTVRLEGEIVDWAVSLDNLLGDSDSVCLSALLLLLVACISAVLAVKACCLRSCDCESSSERRSTRRSRSPGDWLNSWESIVSSFEDFTEGLISRSLVVTLRNNLIAFLKVERFVDQSSGQVVSLPPSKLVDDGRERARSSLSFPLESRLNTARAGGKVSLISSLIIR